ncbi:Gfo/Idh/MocA family oxidoreductase [Sphingomonas solaris]|uniref:Gfo/Idh/MocA family oxidoreductase n=2 Tax=Alterirhizorhabdus solaris TaxID=2529389 RepID=A0A558RB85_9SPHN|nr:Gfo/Idh/MocA family oxidoreductase [Sphingomonas solaris]
MGKIARDQHLPAIAADAGLVLAATSSPNSPGVEGVPHFRTLEALLAEAEVDAVALCSSPQVRYGLAATAIAAGKHVFLEKPPGATLSEVAALEALAGAAGVTLFASWHSRYAAGVEPARAWLAGKRILGGRIVWREDVRHWHPGQAWIWEAGGLGVFDPGINALSIATRIWPRPLFLESATLSLPANRAAPIAADLTLRDATGTAMTMDLDWRQTGTQTWDITVETDGGMLALSSGGAVFTVPGETRHDEDREYPGLYRRFAELVEAGTSDVDIAPFRLVADAFLRGQRETVEAFED